MVSDLRGWLLFCAQRKVLTVPLPGATFSCPPKGMLGYSQCSPPLGCPGAPHFRFSSMNDLLWLTAPSESTETVLGGHWRLNSLAQGSGIQVCQGGNQRHLVSPLRLPWHFYYFSCLLCLPLLFGSTFSVFHHTAFFSPKDSGCGTSLKDASGLAYGWLPSSLCVEATPVTSSTGWRRTKSAASCSAFLLLPLTVPHGKWQKV